MRLLVDEGMPRELGKDLLSHEWSNVRRLRWEGTKNGALLSRAEKSGFDVLVTLDSNMGPEQNMTRRKIAILVLKPRKQGVESIRELAGKALLALAEIVPGEIRVVRHDAPD